MQVICRTTGSLSNTWTPRADGIVSLKFILYVINPFENENVKTNNHFWALKSVCFGSKDPGWKRTFTFIFVLWWWSDFFWGNLNIFLGSKCVTLSFLIQYTIFTFWPPTVSQVSLYLVYFTFQCPSAVIRTIDVGQEVPAPPAHINTGYCLHIKQTY